jgi:hypothetical protein
LSEEFPTKYDPKDPDILSKIANGYTSKIIGEENNVKFLFCACISKDLPKDYRLSVIITSQSSAGKSNLVNTVLEPFKDDVIDYTDYTPAFLKRQEINMNGMILKLEQMEKTNEKNQVTLSTLKFLLSEGRLKVGLVERNEKGKNTPQTLLVTGIPVFISTSTNFNIDPESLNRTFLMQIDETESQTKKIVSHVLGKYKTLRINDSWPQELEELKKLAHAYKGLAHQITDIIIPFADKLMDRIPTADITIRRDLAKILNLTAVIAFIHASNRIRIQDNDGKDFIIDQWANTEKRYTYALIAEPSDFKEAFAIAGITIKQTLNKLNESSMEIYEKFIQLYNSKEYENGTLDGVPSSLKEGVPVREMASKLKKSDNRTRELMNQLWSGGYLSRERTKSREYVYYPTEKKFDDINVDDIEFTKEELEQWIQNQIGNHVEKLTVLYP